MNENSLLNEDDITKVNILKRDFTLNDFLNDDICKDILDSNFNDKLEVLQDKIIYFYKKYVEYNCDNIMLRKDRSHMMGYALLNIIYKYISKDYDITIFYENPNLVNHLLEKYELNNN